MIWLAIPLLATALAGDLNSIRNEPKLDRRAELALENANVALDHARDAYTAGHMEKMQASLDEVWESVDLAYQALSEQARNSRRVPGSFKKAEQGTHALLRRLDGFEQEVDYEYRAKVHKIRDKVAEVNDDLLNRIMNKK